MREQVVSSLCDVGGVEHGSFVGGRNVARAEDEVHLVGKPELCAALAVLKFCRTRAPAEFLHVPGSGGSKVFNRHVIGCSWGEQKHKSSGSIAKEDQTRRIRTALAQSHGRRGVDRLIATSTVVSRLGQVLELTARWGPGHSPSGNERRRSDRPGGPRPH